MKSPALLIALLTLATPVLAGQPFAIEVVDSRTGRGVPLVELRTVNEIRYVTDSRGIVAFDEPGLMGRKVFFSVSGHGYEFPKDGFGFRGKALDVVAGGRGRVEVNRINIAERLYRVIGAGIYRDSVLVGDRVPIREPILDAQVLGSDSVLNAVFRGRVHWFWGDTNRPGYPLGNFHSPTATSKLPGDGGLDIEVGVDLDYAVDADGFAAPSAPLPGEGPTWLDGLTVLKDSSGNERLFAAFAKIKPPMDTYERGLAEFNPETRKFARVASIPLDAPAHPTGHPFHHRTDGVDYVYFADPYPLVRVRADVDDLTHPERFEAFTCLLPGSTVDRPEVDRAPDGSPRYAWRRGARAVDAQGQAKLLKAGAIREADALLQLQDVDTGRKVVAHRGSTYWNDYRGRWVMIAVEIGGSSSFLGEVWLAEADTPARTLGLRPESGHPRQVQLLQPQAAPDVREGGRPADLLRGDVHHHLLRQPEPHPALRLQPDPLQARPRRPPAQPPGADLPRRRPIRPEVPRPSRGLLRPRKAGPRDGARRRARPLPCLAARPQGAAVDHDHPL